MNIMRAVTIITKIYIRNTMTEKETKNKILIAVMACRRSLRVAVRLGNVIGYL